MVKVVDDMICVQLREKECTVQQVHIYTEREGERERENDTQE